MHTTRTVLILAVAAALLASCSGWNPWAQEEASIPVSFNLTDAPVDSANIASVFISFGGLEINESSTAADSDGTWKAVPIDATAEYDLLSLTEGVSSLLGNVDLAAGTRVNQIRFLDPAISILETGAAERLPCAIASATGLKIVNSFAVPLSGSLSLTVDFDVRKSLIFVGGNGVNAGYRMKPVLRAVVDGEAGRITGAASEGFAVYAYKAGTFDLALGDPATLDAPEFSNAYTSTKTRDSDADGAFSYVLAFLEAATYDLVVVDVDTADGTVPTFIAGTDVEVTSGASAVLDLVLP